MYLKNRVNIYTRDTPDYDASFGLGTRLEAAYLYGQGHDMAVNWTYTSRSKEKTLSVDIGDETFDVATTKLDSRMNLFNVEFGQHIDIASHLDMRIHGGFEYALLHSDPQVDVNILNGIQVDAGYMVRGYGPRLGFDLDYLAQNGFGVFLHSSIALLHSSASTSGKVTFTDARQQQHTFSEIGKEFITTAAYEMRGGLKYMHQFTYGDLTIRGGYQTHNFVNVRSRTHNLSWDGGFVGVSWLGFA